MIKNRKKIWQNLYINKQGGKIGEKLAKNQPNT